MALFKLVKKVAINIDAKKGEDTVLKTITPLPDIESKKFMKYLFVGPHPDDIEIGAGATLAKLVQDGKDVYMLICTDGGCGSENPNITPEEISKIRWEESQKAAKYLGVEKIRNLNFEDGGSYSEWELAKEIAKVMYDFAPDVILCPDPNLPTETHPDHLKCARATLDAMYISSYYHIAKRNGLEVEADKIKHSHVLAYYYTNRANTFVEITKELEEMREKALKLHVSQMPFVSRLGSNLYLALRDKHMGKKCGKELAEGFFVMAPMHQHCMSETSKW